MDNTEYPYIGLLVDCHTVESKTPAGTFEFTKRYWDAKNHIYGYKFQVVVSAAAPYYALFVSEPYKGADHDYKIFKETFVTFGDYLRKLPQELRHPGIRQDTIDRHPNPCWAILGDKAYEGPLSDTPGIRKMNIKRNVTNRQEQRNNTILSAHRVYVECFF